MSTNGGLIFGVCQQQQVARLQKGTAAGHEQVVVAVQQNDQTAGRKRQVEHLFTHRPRRLANPYLASRSRLMSQCMARASPKPGSPTSAICWTKKSASSTVEVWAHSLTDSHEKPV